MAWSGLLVRGVDENGLRFHIVEVVREILLEEEEEEEGTLIW